MADKTTEGKPAGDRSANTAIWDRLKITDPKATKPFTRSGGFRGTQIDPTWRIKRMTEEFGPVGKGWGWEQIEAPVIAEGCVFICVRVWWTDPESWQVCRTGPQWGGTELTRGRSGAPNDEAFKMSMTDALGKCLLALGLGADVHMGLFDGSKYQQEAAAHYANDGNSHEKPANSVAAISDSYDPDRKDGTPLYGCDGKLIGRYRSAKDWFEDAHAHVEEIRTPTASTTFADGNAKVLDTMASRGTPGLTRAVEQLRARLDRIGAAG